MFYVLLILKLDLPFRNHLTTLGYSNSKPSYAFYKLLNY